MTPERDALVKLQEPLSAIEQAELSMACQKVLTKDGMLLLRRLLWQVTTLTAQESADTLTIDARIELCSMRPQPGTPAGKAWVDGARQGWKWAQESAAEPVACLECGGTGRSDNHVTGTVECSGCEGEGFISTSPSSPAPDELWEKHTNGWTSMAKNNFLAALAEYGAFIGAAVKARDAEICREHNEINLADAIAREPLG